MTKDTELRRVLANRAHECSVSEFKELLIKFGDNDDHLAAFQKAVDRLSKEEDRGSYCESATPGYNDYLRKEKLLEDYRLGTGSFKKAFNAKTSVPPSDATLQAQVEELTKRVQSLENRLGIHLPKIKVNMRKG